MMMNLNLSSNLIPLPVETKSFQAQEPETKTKANQHDEFVSSNGLFSKQMQIFLEMWY